MWKFEILDRKKHILEHFDCGNAKVNDFLKNTAVRKHSSKESRTYVALEEVPGSISATLVGFYSVASVSIDKAPFPQKIRKRYLAEIPAILIAWFGVSKERQGHGIGKTMLGHALTVIHKQMEAVGGALVIVDPLDDKGPFYEKFGFQKLPESSRCFMTHETVKQVVWPD